MIMSEFLLKHWRMKENCYEHKWNIYNTENYKLILENLTEEEFKSQYEYWNNLENKKRFLKKCSKRKNNFPLTEYEYFNIVFEERKELALKIYDERFWEPPTKCAVN